MAVKDVIKEAPAKNCLNCNGILIRKKIGDRWEDYTVFNRRLFCDWNCYREFEYKNAINKNTYHRKARESIKPQCERCPATEDLHVHHKDKNVRNNHPDNLETLCSSCHLKEHWANDWERRPKNYLGNCPICGIACRLHAGYCQKHYVRIKKYNNPFITKIKIGYGIWKLDIDETGMAAYVARAA